MCIRDRLLYTWYLGQCHPTMYSVCQSQEKWRRNRLKTRTENNDIQNRFDAQKPLNPFICHPTLAAFVSVKWVVGQKTVYISLFVCWALISFLFYAVNWRRKKRRYISFFGVFLVCNRQVSSFAYSSPSILRSNQEQDEEQRIKTTKTKSVIQSSNNHNLRINTI